MRDSSWDPARIVNSLKDEGASLGLDNVELTKSLLRESAPSAVSSITNLALYADDLRTRFNAAKFIVEQALNVAAADGRKDPFEELLAECVSKGVDIRDLD